MTAHDEAKGESVDDAIRVTEEQTAEDLVDLESDQAMTEKALGLLKNQSSTAYASAIAALREDTRKWWEEQLSWIARGL